MIHPQSPFRNVAAVQQHDPCLLEEQMHWMSSRVTLTSISNSVLDHFMIPKEYIKYNTYVSIVIILKIFSTVLIVFWKVVSSVFIILLWLITWPTCGGCSVGIVRLRTKDHGVFFTVIDK
jgi:hypothetical protein